MRGNGRGVLRAGRAARPRGRDQQARRCRPTSRTRSQELAQDQVPAERGIPDRRLQPVRGGGRHRRAAAGRGRGRRAALRRPGRHRLLDGRDEAPARPARRAADQEGAGRAAARGAPQGHRLGAAGAGRRGRVRQPDRGRHPAPRGLQGAARRQGRGPAPAAPAPRQGRAQALRHRCRPRADLGHQSRPRDVRRGRAEQARARAVLRAGRRLDAARADRRPVSLVRCPTGKGEDCFFQRHACAGMPEAVRTIALPRRARRKGRNTSTSRTHAVCSRSPSSARSSSTAGAAGSTSRSGPTAWCSTSIPDEGLPWREVVGAALRGARGAGGARPRAVPEDHRRQGPARRGAARAAPGLGARCARFCEAFARQMAAERRAASPPTWPRRSAAGGSILDYLRNKRGATAVAAYSLRARPGRAGLDAARLGRARRSSTIRPS